MDRTRMDKQYDFLREIDKEKSIFRQTYLADGSRKENDAEHSWHLAMMAMLMCEYANEPVDRLHVMEMVLIHDLIEIDAGDTYAYDTAGNKTKRERELKAAEYAKVKVSMWNSLDKMQPLMLNDASGGKSWTEHDVHNSQVYKRNERTHEGSEAMWKYSDEHFIKPNIGRSLK